jgi:hypothetical protein
MRTLLLSMLVSVLSAAACADDGGAGGCVPGDCAAECQEKGYEDGECTGGGACVCVSGGDGDTDADGDGDADGDSDADGDGFQPTPGTQAEVDRTEPCDPAVDVEPRLAPQDGSTKQYCFPNYDVWAPIECGNVFGLGECDPACGAAWCLPGEAAKYVAADASHGVCACFNRCTIQEDGARCGANDSRPCIPIDDAGGDQVFICGAD